MAKLIDADALIAQLKLQMESYDRIGACERAEAYRNCIWEINEAPTIDGWISVKDRLPDEEDYRSCHENWDGCVIWTNGSDIGLGWYSMTTGDWADIYDCDIDDVTHWMPLPEPPKEDEDDAGQ